MYISYTYAYICIYIHIYMYTYIYIYICICMYICIYIYIFIYIYVFRKRNIYIHVYMYSIDIWWDICMIYTCVKRYTCIFIFICRFICTYICENLVRLIHEINEKVLFNSHILTVLCCNQEICCWKAALATGFIVSCKSMTCCPDLNDTLSCWKCVRLIHETDEKTRESFHALTVNCNEKIWYSKAMGFNVFSESRSHQTVVLAGSGFWVVPPWNPAWFLLCQRIQITSVFYWYLDFRLGEMEAHS